MAMMRGNLDNIPQTLMREPQKTSYMAASMRPFGPAEEKIQSGNEEPGNVFQSRQLDQHHSGDNTEDCCLQKAVEEMKRLDEMLSLETWKEKEIRLERKVLQAKLWQDLLNNSQEHSECALEALNTKQFLALEACVGRDDFVSVFKTEIPDYQNDGGQHDTKKIKKKPDSLNESFEECSEDVGDSQPKNCHYEATKNKSTQKDFIRRNIKLIRGEVGQVLLTRAEKERLAELLRQIDEEEEDSARGAESEAMSSVSLLTDQGYTPEPSDLEKLLDIDFKVHSLLPAEDFHSLKSSSSDLSVSQANSSKAGWKWDGDRQPGEKVLQDIKERREQKRRLQEIEQQLETLDRSQEMTNASPSLTEEQLLMLLNECELTENRTKCHEISG
ncbi:Fibrous sheath-interacting protein 1 [Oryzias melastigma]|uniref:Fibrous sheath-interacting protein 1 n=1 Tax=Oryzias melastigma TaxID=30732 RepID=A0A834CLK9_ORYME|nr:Fibrous sheath-interacting protein 1 [Oryzias melastigma]